MSEPFSIVTWNVNSVRARLDHILSHLEDIDADVVCLQETKVEDRLFPRVPFMEMGYQVHLHGGKALSGVATLTKGPASAVQCGFAQGPADRHPRVLALDFRGHRIYNLYAPNGTALDSDAFPYKLSWFERLRDEVGALVAQERSVLLCGDFNVAPTPLDVWDVEAMRGQLHFTAQEHAALASLCELGLVDAFRKLYPEKREFSWFDYRQGAWQRKAGLRIDHFYVTSALGNTCQAVEHLYATREGESASDHVAVRAIFAATSR
jgi:exodeoxyribonuclease-3